MSPLTEGTHLGRYRLVRMLGAGGMGEVYLAKAEGAGGFEKLVALKVLTTAGQASNRHLDSLQREALIGVQLDHDHVVEILDYGEDDGRHFVAMEFVRGFTLAHVLSHCRDRGQPLPTRGAAHIVRAMAEALRYVHELREPSGAAMELVHGDVTPSNILLSQEGRIKLTDFGIAALGAELRGKGAVAGKPRYLPPEVLKGAPHHQASDVYALGVVLWEVLANRSFPEVAPAGKPSEADLEPPSACDSNPTCPPALAAVAARACSPRPVDRFRTAGALRGALNEVVPREVDDAEVHAAFVRELYGDRSFVDTYGLLPSTGSLGRTYELAPHVTDQTDATVSVPRGLRPLRFGMSPALSSELARQKGERLAHAVGARLKREVRATVFGDYRTLADNLIQGDVDFAWTPPQVFVDVFERGGGMLTIMERDGRITFETGLFVTDAAPQRTLEDLRGASAAWVDRQSASGYLVPYAELLRRLGSDPPPLGRQHFHGSHRTVVEAVNNGWADFGATYLIRDPEGGLSTAGYLDLAPEGGEPMRLLCGLGPIPGDNLSHAPQLAASVVEELIDILESLHEDEEGRETLKTVLGADRLVHGGFELYGELVAAITTIKASA